MKQRRTVILSGLNSHVKWQSKGYRVYGYTVLDLADLFDVSPYTIRRWIRGGKLSPCNLIDIIELYDRKKEKKGESAPQA